MENQATIHRLVPKHVKVSDAEKEALCAQYSVDVKSLPKITVSDPALEGLNVKVGDVIRVERDSKTAGKASYYRLVIGE